MEKMFDRKTFETEFNKAVKKIASAEKVTKEVLRTVSRDILVATHETGDIGFVNRLIAILTPVNKKVAILYFKEFTGFRYDDAALMFTTKNKRTYEEAHKAYANFIAEPANNIWTWAERNVEIEKAPFELSKVTDFVKNAIKKAENAGKSKADVLAAVIEGGFDSDMLIAMLEKMGDVQVEVKG